MKELTRIAQKGFNTVDIKLIAIDLDGTLLDSNHELSKENYSAIQDAKVSDIKVVLCTGRPLRSMNYLLDLLHLKEHGDVAITYNGGLIQETNTGKIIHQSVHSREDCLEIYELGQYLNLPVNFIDLDYIYEPPYPVGADSIYHKGSANIPKEQALIFSELSLDEIPDSFAINKIVMSRPGEELDQAIPKIPQSYYDKYNIYKSQSHILEILPKNVDKGNAMRIVGESLGLRKDQIMGIGDQENDLSLVTHAGLGIAMDNAIDLVKDAADFITKSNNESGVAYAIRKFALK